MKVMEYRLITHENTAFFKCAINQALKLDWELWGNPFVDKKNIS